MTYQQQGLWFLAQTIPDQDQAALNLCYKIDLHGRLDIEALRQAVMALIARHSSLRTRIEIKGAELRQSIGPHDANRLEVIDLQDVIDFQGVRDRAIERRFASAKPANRKFSLLGDILSSFTLLRLGESRHRLVHNSHHLLSDGPSVEILHRDMASLYNSSLSGESSRLPEIECGQHDLALWQHEETGKRRFEEHERYWLSELDVELPVLRLPVDYPRPARQSFRGDTYQLEQHSDLKRRLELYSFRKRATLSSVLLAAFGALLSRYSGDRRLIIGMNFSGRQQGIPLMNSVGFFTNSVPIMIDPGGDERWEALLAHVHQKIALAYDHQEYPLQLLLQKLSPRRDPSRPPLFQVAFNMHSALPDAIVWDGLEESAHERVYTNTTILDLLLHVTLSGDGVKVMFEYCTNLFGRQTIVLMAQRYVRMLGRITENDRPDPSCSRLIDQPPAADVAADLDRAAMAMLKSVRRRAVKPAALRANECEQTSDRPHR